MKKLLFCFCCLPLLATAQNFHFSARFGLAGYHGDIKAASKLLSQTKMMGSIGAQYDLSEHITARTYITSTKLRADDKKGTTAMQQRNLNFETKLLDWEVGAQYNIFSFNDHWWTPYISAGIGIYHFNSYTKDAGGNKAFLQPLSTEGKGFQAGAGQYKRTQISIPIAIGGSYLLGEDMRIGLEAGYRKTFTDYLDDVSSVYVDETSLRNARGQQAVDLAWRGGEVTGSSYPAAGSVRGDSKNKDGYYYIAVTFTIRYWFDKYKQTSGIPGGGSKEKKVGCPSTRAY